MRPLLQHASRSLAAKPASFAPLRLAERVVSQSSTICLGCQYRAASTSVRSNTKARKSPGPQAIWPQRSFSGATRWLEERRTPTSDDPVPPSSPAPGPRPAAEDRLDERASNMMASFAAQKRLQEANARTQEEEKKAASRPPDVVNVAKEPTRSQAREPPSSQNKSAVTDNVARVPDEHLPSHRERQRWDFSKRLSDLMDDMLPKLAVVTQKVNTYTGTDYSGVEALRQEIKEQERLVKARRSAIDTAKQVLETALTQQASAQKEVVALLERKHSWSNGDLERYMSLIRSEHVNDQAVNEAKDAVFEAESALEEARTRLEKRERAQYHEEQIWSDTIRRNSTWVTFGLMGVNIFLLLLSLLILEPWRRRRMVREIKSAMEAQKNANDVAPLAATVSDDVSTTQSDLAKAAEIEPTLTQGAMSSAAPVPVHASSTATVEEMPSPEPVSIGEPVPESILHPTSDTGAPVAGPSLPDELEVSPPKVITPEVSWSDDFSKPQESWPNKARAMAHDAFSERVISMRKIEFTAVIIQSAAAGAVVASAAIIALLRSR